jgi:uncharacterized membrane protein YhhN
MPFIFPWIGLGGGFTNEIVLVVPLIFIGPCTIVGVIGLLVCEYRKWSVARGMFKTFTAGTFLAVVIFGYALRDGNSASWACLLAGLCLGFVGDVLLIGKSQRALLLGLGSFLLGHLAYLAAFYSLGIDWTNVGIAAVALTAVGIPVARFLLPHAPAELRRPIIAYQVVISSMVAAAWGIAGVHDGGGLFFAAAATAFYISDLSVGLERFVSDRFIHRVWGIPLYFGAQFTTALATVALIHDAHLSKIFGL